MLRKQELREIAMPPDPTVPQVDIQVTEKDRERAGTVIDWDKLYSQYFPAVQFMSVATKDDFEESVAEYVALALASQREGGEDSRA